MKKYPKIGTVLKWEEEPDCSEGVFLQPVEAAAIEEALAANEGLQTALEGANARVTELTDQVGTMTTAATAATEKEKTLNERIATLEAEVVTLGGESSGKTGTTLKPITQEEEEGTKTKSTGLPRFDDPEHPANKAAANRGLFNKKQK